MSQINFNTKVVGSITGEFHIPAYQRGYRWGKREVEALLKDISQEGRWPYCL